MDRKSGDKAPTNGTPPARTPEPAWTDTPPATPANQTLTLRRVRGQPIKGYVTCHGVIGVLIHFHKGRTKPHLQGGACEACFDGNSPRWKGYLSLFNQSTQDHWLQEITPQAYAGVENAFQAFGEIHAHAILLERTKPRDNAPVKLTIYQQTLDLRLLPEEPPIKKILYRIWDLDDAVNTPSELPNQLGARLNVQSRPNGHFMTQPTTNNKENST